MNCLSAFIFINKKTCKQRERNNQMSGMHFCPLADPFRKKENHTGALNEEAKSNRGFQNTFNSQTAAWNTGDIIPHPRDWVEALCTGV